MPTYEYRCADCGQHVEVVQSFTDEALTECGACGGRLKKVFGSVGIVFKGSGFYKTDSRPSRSGDGGGSTKTDTKSSDSKSSDSKGSDSKGSDSKGSDSKGSDSKSSDSKSSDSKSSSSSDASAKSA